MIVIENINDTIFSIDGVPYFKNFMSHVVGGKLRIVNVYDTGFVLRDFVPFTQIQLNGDTYGSISDLQDDLIGVLYSRDSLGGSGGGGTLQQVTDIGATTTNPITVGDGSGNYIKLFPDGTLWLAKANGSIVKVSGSGTANNQQFAFPAKANGTYTIATQDYADTLITQLLDGVPTAGNTLNKLYGLIQAINAIIGGSTADADNIVNTVAELLAVFQNYPEGTDIFGLLNGKVNTSDVLNALTQTAAGKVLDARQGKALKDLIDGLSTSLAALSAAALALGETSTTAYRGDRGKTAYDHSQATGNPHGTTAAQVGAYTQAQIDAFFLALQDGVPTAGNTLNKLYNLIQTINAIIGSSSPDADNIVNTVAELLAVFQNYPEGTDIFGLLNSKVNTSDVLNALTQTAAGKVLDARQGKVLRDAIYKRSTFGNVDYTAQNDDRFIVTSVTLTANRTVTLPTGCPAGWEVVVADEAQVIGTFKIIVAPGTGKTLNGTLNGTEIIMAAGGWRRFVCDGNGNWVFDRGIARLSGATFTGNVFAPNIPQLLLNDINSYSLASGTTANQIIKQWGIPVPTISIGDSLHVKFRLNATGTRAANTTIGLMISTSPTAMSGPDRIIRIFIGSGSANIAQSFMVDTIRVTGQTTIVYPDTSGSSTPDETTSVSVLERTNSVSMPFDTNSQMYIHVYGTYGNNTDAGISIHGFEFYRIPAKTSI